MLCFIMLNSYFYGFVSSFLTLLGCNWVKSVLDRQVLGDTCQSQISTWRYTMITMNIIHQPARLLSHRLSCSPTLHTQHKATRGKQSLLKKYIED